MSFLIDFESADAQKKLKALEETLGAIGRKSTQISKDLAGVENVIGKSFKKLKEEADKAKTSSEKLKAETKKHTEETKKSAQELIKAAKSYEMMMKAMSGTSIAITNSTNITVTHSTALRESIRIAELWVTEQKKLQNATESSAIALKKQEAIIGLQVLSAKEFAEAARRASNETRRFGETVGVGSIKLLTHRKDTDKAVQGYQQLRLELKKVVNQYDLLHKSSTRTQVTGPGKGGNTGALLGMNVRNIKEASDKQRELAKNIQKSHVEALKLNAAFDKRAMWWAHTQANHLNKEFDKLRKSGKGAAGGISDFTKSSRRAAKEAAALRAALNAVGTHMGIFTSQTILVASAVYAVVSAFKGMVTSGISFTGEMTRAIPIMGASATQAAMLEQEVRRLGETTKFTAVEASGGLTALAMAGLSSTQALEALAPALNLASIGQIDMYRSADILTNVMNGFRLSAEDVPGIVDDLATAITSSNATIEQMAGALSYVAPVAVAAGGSIEEVTAILEVFHNAGIKGSRAGTSLRRAYSNLLKPSEAASKVLKELGVNTKDANGHMLEMTDVMNQLAEKGALASDIIELFGVRASPAMLALLQDLQGVNSEFDIFYRSLKNNKGASDDLRKEMEENLGTDLQKLISALTEQALRLFDELESGFRSSAQQVTEFIRSLSKEDIKAFAEGLKTTAKVLMAIADAAILAAKIWVVVKAVKALGIAVGFAKGVWALTAAWSGLNGVLSVTTGVLATTSAASLTAAVSVRIFGIAVATALGPIGLLIAAVGIGYSVYTHFSDGVDSATESIKALTKGEKDLAAQQDRVMDNAKRHRKLIVSEGVEGPDRTASKMIKRIADLTKTKNDIQAELDLVAQDAIVFGPQQFEGGIKATAAHIQVLTQNFSDAESQIAKTEKELKIYNDTGIDPQGARTIERFNKALEASAKITFSDSSALILKQMSTAVQEISNLGKTDQLNAAEVLLGTESSIANKAAALSKAYTETIIPLSKKLVELDPRNRGVGANGEAFLETLEKLKTVSKDYATVLETLAKAQDKASTGFSKFLAKGDDLILSGQRRAEILQSEIDKLNGVATLSKNVADIKLQERLATISLNIAVLSGVDGKEDEVKALQVQLGTTTDLIAEINRLRVAKEAAKQVSEGRKQTEKLTKEFGAGKGLATDDKAQAEYDAGVKRLADYLTLNESLLATDKWYVDAKMELDKNLWESQNEMWVGIGESASKTVSENLSQALMLQQSWSDTGKNIKKSIYSSIISSLVAAGVETAANAVMSIFWKDKEVVSEGLKAAAITSTGIASASTGAIQVATTAANSVAHAAATVALVASGSAVAAAWTLPAYLVSLGSFGTNSVAAIAGIEATALASIQANTMVAASGLLGREIGGPVNAGQSYIVGEKGAEIFTPTTSGAITSNADVKRGLNGGGAAINNYYYTYEGDEININAMDARSIQQTLAENSSFLTNLNDKENRRRGIVPRRS